MRQMRLLAEKEVVALLEANGTVYPLELGTAPQRVRRVGDLCGDRHDVVVLAREVVDWKTGEGCERSV